MNLDSSPQKGAPMLRIDGLEVRYGKAVATPWK